MSKEIRIKDTYNPGSITSPGWDCIFVPANEGFDMRKHCIGRGRERGEDRDI